METWKATIKEKGNEHLLTPEYSFPDSSMFWYITNECQREYEIRKFLTNFWGLDKAYVEWYKLEKTNG